MLQPQQTLQMDLERDISIPRSSYRFNHIFDKILVHVLPLSSVLQVWTIPASHTASLLIGPSLLVRPAEQLSSFLTLFHWIPPPLRRSPRRLFQSYLINIFRSRLHDQA